MRIGSDVGILIFLAIIVGVFLIVRGFNLWYWRINERMDVLNKINSNLEQLNKKVNTLQVSVDALSSISENPSVSNQTTDPNVPSSPAPVPTPINNSDIPEM